MPENFDLYQVPACRGGTLYTIIPGDSFYGLARRFNITVNAIVVANPGVDPNDLQIGQIICIPAPPIGNCPGGFLYAIRSGDTYYAIAQRYGIVVDALIAANPGVDPNRLAIGQVICVPAPRPTPTPTPTPIPCPGGQLYTIRSGDTLFAIASRFNTTVAALRRANPGIDPNSLRVGQIICIPVPAPTTTPVPCPGGQLYRIRSGDTLFSIAEDFGTTVAALRRANPGINPNNLRVGQVICIPVPAPTTTPIPCPGGQLYTVRAGDTLLNLANRFNTTVQDILDANPGLVRPIRVGQVICIPVPAPTTTPTPIPCPGGQLYTVRAGDNLFNLANRFNTTVDDILDANPGLVRPIRVGQVICIPVPAPTTTPIPCPGGRLYTIRVGDTLFSIARRFNVSANDILDANPLITDPNFLRVGQIICIPD